MADSKGQPEEIRRELIRRINEFGDRFRMSAFIDDNGVDPGQASEIAQSVFARFYADVIEDGEITDREHRQLHKLATRLEIDDDRRREIERKLAASAFRQQLAEAREDGVVTDEERAELQRLKSELGLVRSPESRSTEPAGVFATVRASREYADRESPERLAHLQNYHRGSKAFLGCAVYGVLALGLFAIVVAMLLAVVAFAADVGGARPILLGIAAIFLLGGAWISWAGGVSAMTLQKRMHAIERSPVVTKAAVVYDMRRIIDRHQTRIGLNWDLNDSILQSRFRKRLKNKRNKHGNRKSTFVFNYTLYVTFEDEQGTRTELDFFGGVNGSFGLFGHREGVEDPYHSLAIGDAGVLFLRGDTAVGFDVVVSAKNRTPEFDDDDLNEFLKPTGWYRPRDQLKERSIREKLNGHGGR